MSTDAVAATMSDSTRYNVAGALSFAALGLVAGLVIVEGVSLLTYVLGVMCVGAVWMKMPVSTQFVGLLRERGYVALPVAFLWPLTALPVLLFLFIAVSDRPRTILGGAVLASMVITGLVVCDPPAPARSGSRAEMPATTVK